MCTRKLNSLFDRVVPFRCGGSGVLESDPVTLSVFTVTALNTDFLDVSLM